MAATIIHRLQWTIPSFLFLLQHLFIIFDPVNSIHPPTNVLDVAASIKATHEALHHSPPQQEQLSEVETASVDKPSYFSVTVHPRISLHTPTHHRHKNYKSLTKSRLARDTARVHSLQTKLDLSIRGISRSDLKPAEAQYATEAELVSPVTSGSNMGSGEYFARIGVGQPSIPYYLVLDTGSDVSWLQCDPCSNCYQQSDPIYKPSSSSTYTPIECSTPLCHQLDISACPRTGTDCLYQVSYGDGSFTVGNFMTETVSFGKSGSVNKVAMGCGHDNEGLFVASAGLLGLGGGSLSLPSQIKATSFSYCLVDRDSGKSSTLEFNSPSPSGSVTTQLVKDGQINTFYYVSLTGMSVGGNPVSISPSRFGTSLSSGSGVIVDSGTAITRLPTGVYESLRDAFTKLTPNLPKASSVALFDTCYDFSKMTEARVPTVSFRFGGGGELNLPAKNYLIPVDEKGTFCFAFAPTTSSMSIIGNVQQQGIRVHYDLAKSVVYFSPNSC